MKFWKKPKIKDLLPPPVQADHGEYSMILSMHDEPVKPTEDLMKVCLKAATKAQEMPLASLKEREPEHPHLFLFPGEHYRLLAAFCKVLKPKNVIEIGTATGLSALAMKSAIPKKGKITTFDLVPWSSLENTHLKEEDFDDQLEQIIDNLEEEGIGKKHEALLQTADLIFIDTKHDGASEKSILQTLEKISFEKAPYVIMDDIRVFTMLKCWRDIPYPKIDLTSFGHWSGTGVFKMEPAL